MMRAALFLFLFLPVIVSAQPPGSQWQYSITPYVWLPDIDGTLSYEVPSRAGGRPTVSVGSDSYLENLADRPDPSEETGS